MAIPQQQWQVGSVAHPSFLSNCSATPCAQAAIPSAAAACLQAPSGLLGDWQRMLQQRLAAVRGPDGHRVEARQVSGRAVAGLEAAAGVGGRAEGAGLLGALAPLRELLVVLELLGVVLEHPELGGGLRLHVFVVVPLAALAGHLARGRARHRLRVLVGQRPGDRLPCEDVGYHKAVLLGAPCVLGEVYEVRLEAVVGPLGRALAQAPGLRGQARNAKRPVQPLLAAAQAADRGSFGELPRPEADAGDGRLRGRDARLPQPAAQHQGLRRVEAVHA